MGVDFKMKMMLFPKMGPWYMAQARIATVQFITLPLVVSAEFWKVWGSVYRAPK